MTPTIQRKPDLFVASIEDVRRATAGEERLLSATDVVQVVVALDGREQAAMLRARWQELVCRHAALRTAFRWRDCALPLAITYR